MGFMTSIVDALNSVSSWFYQIYLEVYGWVYPFWLAAPLFYQLSVLFNTLAWRFYDFSLWVSDVQSKVASILSWDAIWSYLLSYVPNLVTIRDWFYSLSANLLTFISSWWSATQATVKGWISAATQGFNDMLAAWSNFWNTLWPQLTSGFNSLKSAWDNFCKVTLPSLITSMGLDTWWNSRLKDLDNLINTAFTARQSLWDGWQDWKEQVAEFFEDPVEFIWQRFADWFLGPEG